MDIPYSLTNLSAPVIEVVKSIQTDAETECFFVNSQSLQLNAFKKWIWLPILVYILLHVHSSKLFILRLLAKLKNTEMLIISIFYKYIINIFIRQLG